MSQCLPTGNLKWVEYLEGFDYNVPDDNPIGFILEVDLRFPKDIHDRQSDLPMAPTQQIPPGSKQKKMLATLYDKEKYILHYRNLKQYVSEGIILTKIHRVLQFTQSPWLKKYIDLNTMLRQKANNEFDKNSYKLLNNAAFGKTMENVRNRRVIKLVCKREGRYGAQAYIAKPNFYKSTIFAENLVAIELAKTDVLFNKPVYVGISILDISKTVLYDFHYKYIQDNYGTKATLCYTDTDSLIYHVTTDDIYKDMLLNIKYFHTSEYPANNIYNISQINKKVPGRMKDENNGQIMLEFVGLRAKMYAIKVEGNRVTKMAKGIKNYVVKKKKIQFDDYVKCLNTCVEMSCEQKLITTKLHKLYTKKMKKVSLSPLDDKRKILADNLNALPWGHYSLISPDFFVFF